MPRAMHLIQQARQERIGRTGKTQVDDLRFAGPSATSSACANEKLEHCAVGLLGVDGPAGAQRRDAHVGCDADDAFVVVHRRSDDARNGGAVDLAPRRLARVDEIARHAHAAA